MKQQDSTPASMMVSSFRVIVHPTLQRKDVSVKLN